MRDYSTSEGVGRATAPYPAGAPGIHPQAHSFGSRLLNDKRPTADGHAPPETAMNPAQVVLIRRSFEFFKPCGPALVAHATRGLIDSHSVLGSHIPANPAALHKRCFETLEQIVRRCDRFGTLQAPLGELGRRAARHGLSHLHYGTMKEHLLRAMADLAGADWGPGLEEAWGLLLDATIGAMAAGSVPTSKAA